MLGNGTNIFSIQCDRTFCYIIKSWDQVDHRRFTTTGTSDDRRCLSRFCCKADIMKYVFFCSRITEGYVVKFYFAFSGFFQFFRCFRIFDRCPACQDLIHTVCCNSCSWKHNRNHTDHKEGHDDLHCILDKCHHITNLHLPVTDTMCTAPYNQYGNSVHDQHHHRHHKCHGTVYK